MQPDEFRAWRKRMGWKRDEAARRLGASLSSVSFYENGKRPDKEEKVGIPISITWACVALEAGIENPFIKEEIL